MDKRYVETRIDEDLAKFTLSLAMNEMPVFDAMQKLVEDARAKFEASCFYVCESMVDDFGFYFDAISYDGDEFKEFEKNIYLPKLSYNPIVEWYVDDCISTNNLPTLPHNENYSVLHCGFVTGPLFEGCMGMIVDDPYKEWTLEEICAIRKMGNLLRTYVHASRADKMVDNYNSQMINLVKDYEEEVTDSLFFEHFVGQEVRNKVNAIEGLTALLLKAEDEEKTSDYINKIHCEANALLQLNETACSYKSIEEVKQSRLQVAKRICENRILVVDDNPLNNEIALSVLQDAGYDVDVVENGHAAIAMVSGMPYRYGLVLMDINMPDLNGYQTSLAIRAVDNEFAAMVPIVAVTGNDTSKDRALARKVGIDSYAVKPINYIKLVESLDVIPKPEKTGEN